MTPGVSTGARRRGRECALQVLYSLDVNPGIPVEQALAGFWRDFNQERQEGDAEGDRESMIGAEGAQKRGPVEGEAEPASVLFAESLVRGTFANLAEIDGIVQKASKNWRLERMARVDRNLLRMATYELRFVADVPVKVVINEAIEVAKRFGAAESPAFVNGLLDRISQELGRTS